MNKYWLLLLLAVLIAASILYRRWAVNYGLKQLYVLRNSGDSEKFLQALDSSYIRLQFSPFARKFMKLNYWIDKGEDHQVEQLLPELEEEKCSDKDRVAFYSRALGYALDRRQYRRAEEYMDRLGSLLQKRNDPRSKALRLELEQLRGIYLQKDTALIPVLEELLTQTQGENASVLCYRLARLYRAKGEEERTGEYLERALRLTEQGPSQKTLRAAIKDHSLLD